MLRLTLSNALAHRGRLALTWLAVTLGIAFVAGSLVLTDTTGKTTSDLIVQDLSDGHAGEDLGLVGNSTGTTTITGTDINFVSRDTNLSSINDGRGIRTAATGNDFTVNLGDGSNFSVSLIRKTTVGDVIDAINTAGGAKIKASAVAGSNGIKLEDVSGGGRAHRRGGSSRGVDDAAGGERRDDHDESEGAHRRRSLRAVCEGSVRTGADRRREPSGSTGVPEKPEPLRGAWTSGAGRNAPPR